jgi:hypothetical protein
MLHPWLKGFRVGVYPKPYNLFEQHTTYVLHKQFGVSLRSVLSLLTFLKTTNSAYPNTASESTVGS